MTLSRELEPASKSQVLAVKSLLSLTLPAALSAMLNNAYRIIDQQAVQWLGVDAQAAIASCSFVLISFFAVYSIFSSGALASIARAAGRGDKPAQEALIGGALFSAFLTGMLVLTLSGIAAPWTASTLGMKGELADQAEAFLSWHALFCLPQAVMPTLDAVFIAYGRTKVVLMLQITASALNFLLNPVFIYDWHFGIGGAAVASGISQGVALLVGLNILLNGRMLSWRSCRFNRHILHIVRIGLPVCSGTLIFSGVYWSLLRWVVSPLGAEVNAALGIGFSVLEGLTWPVFWGFSMGIASIVGRGLGAGDHIGVDRAIRLAFKMLSVCGLLAAAVFWYWGEALATLFTQDQEVLTQAVLYAQILAFSQLFVAYEALAEGILDGAGSTRLAFYWSAPLNVLRVPVAWLFAVYYGYGPAAVWWVINISTFLKASGKWATVLSGRWRNQIL